MEDNVIKIIAVAATCHDINDFDPVGLMLTGVIVLLAWLAQKKSIKWFMAVSLGLGLPMIIKILFDFFV